MNGLEHQAITNLERLPRHAGPGGTAVRCRCGKVLCVVEAGLVFIRHDGRDVTATLPAEVRCDCCGHRTTIGLTTAHH
jgi:hypothetical protein